jgi:beta-glucosidase
MTEDEKFTLIHGSPGPYVGNVPAIERLGIPALNLEDGPQGVADGVHNVTCWPSVMTVTATFDTQLIYQYS